MALPTVVLMLELTPFWVIIVIMQQVAQPLGLGRLVEEQYWCSVAIFPFSPTLTGNSKILGITHFSTGHCYNSPFTLYVLYY